MSTILEALRKIEEERQGQAGEVRARLLTRSARRISPAPPHRSLLWTAGVSFILAGFTVGVWVARQEGIPTEEGGTLLTRLSEDAETGYRFPPPAVSDSFGDSEKTVSAGTEQQAQEGQKRTGSVTDPLTPEHPLVLSEPPPIQDSPFVSSTQIALRKPPVDAAPQEFSEPSSGKARQQRAEPQKRKDRVPHVSETVGEIPESVQGEGGREAHGGDMEGYRQEKSLEQGEPAGRGESDESEDAYAPAPANSALSFLQWSPESARRKAFVRVGGSPFTLVHEGDSVGGYTVVEIQQDAVALRSGATRFRLRVR